MDINYSTLAPIMFDSVKLVGVKFFNNAGKITKGSHTYVYKTTFDLEVEDDVVVQTNGRLEVVRVTTLDCELDENIEYKWVLSTLNYDDYNAAIVAENKLVRRVRARRHLSTRDQILNALGMDAKEVQLLAAPKEE